MFARVLEMIGDFLGAFACMACVLLLCQISSKKYRTNLERVTACTFPAFRWRYQKVVVKPDFNLGRFWRHCDDLATEARVDSNIGFADTGDELKFNLKLTVKNGFLYIRPKRIIILHPGLFVLMGTLAVRPVIGAVWALGYLLIFTFDFDGEASAVRVLAEKYSRGTVQSI